MLADLHVVTAVSNPERYQSRYRLYREFEKRCIEAGAKLYTVEAAFGERPHEVTTSTNPCHVQVRTSSQIWHKENLLNVGISRLPKDWKYVAWVDCDVMFANPNWVNETLHQLQHFQVVQMFSHFQELLADHSPMDPYYSGTPVGWAYGYQHNLPSSRVGLSSGEYGLLRGNYYWHPGYAWAARREAFDHLGGLVDHMVVGGADFVMAVCLTGVGSVPPWANYGSSGRWVREWKGRADTYIRGNVGYVPGLLTHYWHGKKAQRQYRSRHEIITTNRFDPEVDLKRDWQGLWQLTDKNVNLRDQIRHYFRARNEDSIDLA